MKKYTREQLIDGDLKVRQLFETNPEKFKETENIPTREQSATNVDFMLNLIKK